MSGIAKNMTGKTFGMLTVLYRDNDQGGGKKPVVKWICKCECGKMISVKGDNLRSGHTISCGCQKVKHGESYKHKTRLYNIWKCMRQRCNNPNNPSYPNYGGKGIRICLDWDDYTNFRDWAMNSGYADDLSIDRIDVNGNYEPANCRWADSYLQMNNTSRNKHVVYHGELMTMAEVARKKGVSYSTIQHRVERGQSLED